VRVRIFGQVERLPAGPRRAVAEIERVTAGNDVLELNLMISYGGRAELVRAAQRLASRVQAGELKPADIDEDLLERELYTYGLPDPDLLIRTSGEQRISNFMLWQLAYTELYITPVLWPDFGRAHLFQAIHDYQKRERRFGRVNAV
jgi:undecaprenyl diphosphate synthase